jgi:diguanylate cyclase (GGDEF)-like protein/PAS domain S-box-containing protein
MRAGSVGPRLTQTGHPQDEPARLQTLLAFQRDLSAAPADLPSLLTLVAQCAQSLAGAAGALVEIPAAGALVCRAATGSASSLLGLHGCMEGGLSVEAFAGGKTLRCDDLDTDGVGEADARVERSAHCGSGHRSRVTVPVSASNGRFGVLTVVSPHPRSFGDEDVQSLQLLAAITAANIAASKDLQRQGALLGEQTLALAALRESESRFRHVFDDAPIGMALIAPDDRWLNVNAALCDLVGYSPTELGSRHLPLITHPDDRELVQAFTQQILAGEIPTGEIEIRCVQKNGNAVWILLTVSAVKDADELGPHLNAQLHDITARKEAEETLRRLATRDYLTGLHNRRELVRLLGEETLRADRHQRPLSLIMVDIDSFKCVNDAFGHQVGDRVLQHVAAMLTEAVRSFDRVARYGGEEFVVLLPETSTADALTIAERIRARIAAEPFSVVENGAASLSIPLTISAGIATVRPPVAEAGEAVFSQLIKDADCHLYMAKQSGRNRCVARLTNGETPRSLG